MELPSRVEVLALLSDGDIYTFDQMYRSVQELEAAEKSGDSLRLKELDFALCPMCLRCSKPCLDSVTKKWKPMQCGGCQGVLYCSRACQVADWKKNRMPNALSHKELCARNKEHMKRIPYFRSEFEQFPWARTESDGSCSHDLLRARFGVLGTGSSFGYWSVPGGFKGHDASSTVLQHIRSPEWINSLKNRSPKQRKPAKARVHGEVMLGDAWPTDIDAWKLNGNEKGVPRLFFTDDAPAPDRPKPGQVKNWWSWYEWRGLSLDSPAALMMDYSMSVYHLLVDVLKVVDLRSISNTKRTLEVHYIGAEVELNFLPLFSELALLLPNTHINLTIFGKPAYDLVRAAHKSHSGSVATQDPLWSYTAPKKTGSGSIDIRIHTETEDWTRQVVDDKGVPDAMVGMNAGLLSYPAWGDPMLISGILDIPFGVTEYCEQSMETFATALPIIFAQQASGMGSSRDSAFYQTLTKKRTHPISANPFHRPGQRPLPVVRTPNYYNGFAMPVVGRV